MSPRDLRYAERRPAATIGPAETRRRPATDQWLSSSARRAGRGRVRGVERRLARRLLRAIGSPPVGLVLWNGEEIAESNRSRHTPCAVVPHTACADYVARILFRDRAAFWKVLLDPNFQFGEAYAEGRLEVGGDLVFAAGDDLSLACGGKPVGPRRLLGPARLAASGQEQHARRRPAEHPPSLRHRRRLLPAVARSGDGL